MDCSKVVGYYMKKLNAPYFCPKIENLKILLEEEYDGSDVNLFAEKIFSEMYEDAILQDKRKLPKDDEFNKYFPNISKCSSCKGISCYKMQGNKHIISFIEKKDGKFYRESFEVENEEIIDEIDCEKIINGIKRAVEERKEKDRRSGDLYI